MLKAIVLILFTITAFHFAAKSAAEEYKMLPETEESSNGS